VPIATQELVGELAFALRDSGPMELHVSASSYVSARKVVCTTVTFR
jgi:hypothetical protein